MGHALLFNLRQISLMHVVCIAAYTIDRLFESQSMLAVTFEPINYATFTKGGAPHEQGVLVVLRAGGPRAS